MSKILNSPFYSNKLHRTGKTVYSTTDHIYTIVDYNYSYEATFSASLYHKTIDQIYPIRTKYLYSSVELESFETIGANQKDSYPIKYELLYRSNDRYIKIEEAVSENGKASFTNLIKGYTYYIKAIDTSGKYQSKMSPYIPTEYDNTQEPQLLVSYKDLSYEKFQYYFITANVLGEKYVYLENNSDHIKLEKLDDKRYKISLTEVKNRADEFDLVYEEHRDEDIIKKVERIYINDGFSTAYDISINFTENGSVTFKWYVDGTIDYFNIYLNSNQNSEPVIGTGLTTYITNEYDATKTQYFKIGTKHNEKEKFSEEIIINAVDDNFFNVDLLMLPEASTYPSTLFTDLSIYKNTISNLNNNVRIVNDGTQYFDFPTAGCCVKTNTTIKNNMDFTAEAFVKLTANPTQHKYILQLGELSSNGTMCISFDDTRKLWANVVHNSQYVGAIVSNSALEINKWEHVCLIRKSNKLYLFLNGNLLGTDVNYADRAIQSTSLYIGTNSPSIVAAPSFNGFMKSIRISDFIRYNLTGFDVPNYEFPKYTSISKPDNIRYSIKDNNDLQIDIIHENNNVDNYSVYLEENEITSITDLTPIATSASKNIVIPNFDVYNNYDRTLKLVATTNKYNHSYLSENKDLYVAYDWTPDNILSIRSWLISDNTSNTLINGRLSIIADKSGKNANAVQYNNTDTSSANIIKGALNGRDVWECSNSTYKGIFDIQDKTISKNAAGITLAIVSKLSSLVGTSDMNILRINTGAGYTARAMIGRGYYGENVVYGGVRRLDNDQFFGINNATNMGTDWIITICTIDYIKSKIVLSVNGNIYEDNLPFNGNVENTDSYGISIGHYGGGVSDSLGIGQYAESIIFDSAINNEQRINLEGYLANQWGLTDNLPSDHPYKTKRPIIDHAPINIEGKNEY